MREREREREKERGRQRERENEREREREYPSLLWIQLIPVHITKTAVDFSMTSKSNIRSFILPNLVWGCNLQTWSHDRVCFSTLLPSS